ncbi:uncharacterized protein LOC132716141 [Ruditapes philippinarum]|uniref:uncharacterized protein LOC132716141 n=1 Tax=Ruditapes philippinarum TaxID=129788 RepID=UPI00295C0DEF|nr:uncharacterized protein LOC132716141 [Ruditapes philippinarum]
MFLSVFSVLVYTGWVVQGAEIWSWSHESSNKDINSVLRDAFDYHDHKGQFGIGADDSLSLAEDPESSGQFVLRVFYKKGTWSGHRSDGHSCSSGEKCHRGAQFYASPSAMSHHSYTTLTLQYEVYFPDSFSWNRGGKLPGLWGGTRDCSGGRIRDTCFSTRLMWRPLGDGEVYAYVTHNQEGSWHDWCSKYDTSSTESYRHIHCTPTSGIEMGRGAFRFHHHKWHKIRQEVQLNRNAGEKGYIKLWVDDHAELHVTDVIMRDNTHFDIDGIFFSTFYGGGDSSWACPRDTYTYFRNFRLSTDTKTPSHSQLVG